MTHPVATANCVAWYRGDSLVDGGGGVASSWADKATGGLNLAANNSPTIVDSGLNSRLAANFVKTSSQSFSRATTPATVQPLTIAVVALVNDLVGGEFDVMVDRDTAGVPCSLTYADNAGADELSMYAGGSNVEVGAIAAGTWRLHLAAFNGIGSALYVDNALISAVGADVGANGLAGIRVGNGVFANQHHDGRIAEVVVWNKVLDSGERDALFAYYQDYYFGDITAPVLSNATAAETGETTAALAVDTDEGNGTLFWVVTQSVTPPSGAQVAAGQDHTGAPAADSGSQAVAGTGTQNIAGGAAGLTAGTTYWAHFVHDDAASNRSNVASSASFTTDSAGPVAELPSAGSGGRRGRRYPYLNVIDDGWDWDAPDARAEPEKPQDEPERPRAAVPKTVRVGGLAAARAPVQPPEPAVERARPAPALAASDKVEPAAGSAVSLAAEVAALREQVERLEEERLLSWLLDDE